MDKDFSKDELLKKIELLELEDEGQRNHIVCSLIGHSRITEYCLGYIHCARCKAQIGDTLAGVFDLTGKVIVGHNCKKCHTNYDNLTWRDTIFCPDPFGPEEDGAADD